MSKTRLYRAALRERLFFRREVLPNGCWLWQGSKSSGGYGTINIGKKIRQVHRVAYEEFVGPIPQGLLVRHTCDTPACFNPEHLCTGTDEDNVQDAVLRGRKAIGAMCNKSSLTTEAVKAIRADPRTLRAIARDYGLCHSSVGEIKRRQTWAHIR